MKDIVGLNDGHGTLLVNVHTIDQCAPQHCCIHNPSRHHMNTWAPRWDGLLKQMWRICPHDLAHPDPDDLAFVRMRWGGSDAAISSMHTCDGCCQPARTKEIEGGNSDRAEGASDAAAA